MAGRRIDDHSSWIGKGSKGMVFPDGCKTKTFDSAVGAGHLGNYEDTTEAIKSQQEKNISKTKAHPMKEGYRH